jgi:type I site-specific restriction endonuclease
MDKSTLSESDICDLFISPAIQRVGWDPKKITFEQLKKGLEQKLAGDQPKLDARWRR